MHPPWISNLLPPMAFMVVCERGTAGTKASGCGYTCVQRFIPYRCFHGSALGKPH